MHIHPNNNLLLASLGSGREDVNAIQAKRAAEVRKKLSAASHLGGPAEAEPSSARCVDARSYEAEEQRQVEEDGFGRLFSAKA